MGASVPGVRAKVWYLQARVAEGLGDEATAARGMSWARRLDGNDIELLRLLAEHAERQDDPRGRLELCLDALELPTTEGPCTRAWAHRGAASAWLALGHAGEARRQLDPLADAGCPDAEAEVAWAHATGDRAGAQALLETWTPERPAARMAAARWALDLDRPDLALSWLAPLTGHPDWPAAADLLVEVAPHHPDAVRVLLDAVAPTAGAPWTEARQTISGGSP